MIKTILYTLTVVSLLGVFNPASAQKTKQGTTTAAKSDLKFLDDISFEATPVKDTSAYIAPAKPAVAAKPSESRKDAVVPASFNASTSIENASGLQLKYALIMNLEVEQIRNLPLFRLIDDWFGTPYHLGGTSKMGIDCSALMQVFFTALYGITLPRTAREQFDASRRVSRTELREGDLVFFNTRGGVSHVGMYLQNNKFVHASSSGVTISDLYEDYWSRHFIGVGRVDSLPVATALSRPQP